MIFYFVWKDQVQVGEVVAKIFQKPGMKKKMVYFGEVDVVHENADPDVFCHVRYEDDDEEDLSYLELQKAKRFFQESTIIGVFFLPAWFVVHMLFDQKNIKLCGFVDDLASATWQDLRRVGFTKIFAKRLVKLRM